jgi:hypothetical protein
MSGVGRFSVYSGFSRWDCKNLSGVGRFSVYSRFGLDRFHYSMYFMRSLEI